MILPQLDTSVTTSFLLFLQHEILRQGSGFQNLSSLFYPDVNEIQGLYTYTSPYKPFVNDTSIGGANIISGVYLNGNFINVGQSGLYAINHEQGAIYFTQNMNHFTISGNFAVADFDVRISDQPDYKVVLDQKYAPNPKYSQLATGIPEDVQVFPAIILVPKQQYTAPFAFAGVDDNRLKIRGIIVTENVYQRMSIGSILKNLRLKQFPLIASTTFDYLGNMTGINYNYLTSWQFSNYAPYILSAKITEIPERGSFTDLTKQFSMVDFDISTWAGHN